MKHFLNSSLIEFLLILTTVANVQCQRNFDASAQVNRLAAAADVNDFWANVTGALEAKIRWQSLAVLQEWNQAVEREGLKYRVSNQCLAVVEQIIRHPLEQEWSAQIIDSMKLTPSGILSGTTTELGDFDQCLAVDGHFGGDHFVGKYCLATVNLPRANLFSPSGLNRSSLKHEWMANRIEKWYQNDNYYAVATGVCFPSLCQAEEIKEMLTAYYPILNSFDFNVTYCQAKDEQRQYDQRIWIALFILALPWLLIIPGTLFEVLYCGQPSSEDQAKTKIEPIEDSLLVQILLGFSLLSNSRILFRMVDSGDNNTIKTESSGQSVVNAKFQFVHGIRALASIFIIIAHNSAFVIVPYQMGVSVVARHPTDFIALSKQLIAQPFYNGSLIVLTFFLISGMFLSFWTASKRRLRLPFTSYVTLRWLRYTPPMIGMLCLTVAMELVGSSGPGRGGPLFHHDHLWRTLKPCYEDWMAHLLFYSNTRDIDKTCGIQTWYISVEMQLHLLAFIFLLAYTRSRRLASMVAIGFIATGMALIVFFVAAGKASLPLVQVIVHTQFAPANDAVRYIFFAITMNIIPYFVGVLVGQALLEGWRLKASPTWSRFAWALTAVIFLGLPMASLPNAGDLALVEGNRSVGNAVSFALAVLLWSLANAWLVFNCVTRAGRFPLSRFLSAKIWQPLSRLSFSLYLVHIITVWYNVYQTRNSINSSAMNEIYKMICLSIAQSFMLAYLLYVSFEAPSVNLIKLFISKQESAAAAAAKNLQKQQLLKRNGTTDLNNNNKTTHLNGSAVRGDCTVSSAEKVD